MSFMVNNSIRVSSCDTQCNHTYGRRPDTRNEVSLDTLSVYRRVIIIIGFDLNLIFFDKTIFLIDLLRNKYQCFMSITIRFQEK